jgi:hypothetical protein
MIDLLLKVLKSLEDVGQKKSFLKFMGLLASGTFPLHNIKILTGVLLYWSIQLLFVGFLIKYVS